MADSMPASLPSMQALAGLAARVGQCYAGALSAKAAFFYPSNVVVMRQTFEAPSSSSSKRGVAGATSVPWTIRCVPALLDKAREKAAKGSSAPGGPAAAAPAAAPAPASSSSSSSQGGGTSGQNPKDVFSPPYDDRLLVSDDQATHRGYTILLNKFCVVPRHFLLVTRDFEPQSQPPAPAMLALAYKIVHAHARLADAGATDDVGRGKELLAFYNCGSVSGASQPHQHLQFAEVGNEERETDQAKGTTTAAYRYKVPIEALLDRIEHDGKEQDTVHALPLPYQHFVVLLGRGQQLVGADDDAQLSDYLGNKLLGLLDALFQARISAAAAAAQAADAPQPTERRGPPSWNLLLTTRAMHLVPRQKEEFDGLKEPKAGHDDDEAVGSLSINSLGYAGHLLVKSDRELAALQAYPGGVEAVLASTGVPPVADVTTASGPGP
ncbi:hypothetical protein FA10DRAFT_268365 [Acaromyces ingoldii]|uniref:Uncharacterized protein n=1 Tax=Acaromyces ingoldii TaxID=215250 RepID=A0A316YGB1_9BASI|nr:hypothetical protein FA10DRAFT_268365 [Acaromyces ingoldii]PWN88146.1 hypothetical protein FA10DRAFT_268365 [Acaromyces ingoldii]